MLNPGTAAACLDDLASRRLVFVTGKGGTGKSTFSALLGRRAAARGVRTLLVELDSRSALRGMFSRAAGGGPLSTATRKLVTRSPTERAPRARRDDEAVAAPPRGGATLPSASGTGEVGTELRGAVLSVGFQPVALAPDLFAVNIDSENAVVSYLTEALGSPAIAKMVINNRVIRYFYDAVPAGREIVVLNRLYSLVTAGRTPDAREFDLFVVDMPASGHALSLLQLPATAGGAFGVGPVAKRARQMQEALFNPRTSSLVLVAIPEEMAVAETIEFHARFRDECHAPVRAVVVNMVPQPFLDDASAIVYREARGGGGDDRLPPAVAALVRACEWDMERSRQKLRQLRALGERLPGVVSLQLIEKGEVLSGLEARFGI